MNAALLEQTLAKARRQAWQRGKLSYKLQAHQVPVYDKYRAWQRRPIASEKAGELRRLFLMDIGRRWGKTYLVLLILIEDALRMPGARLLFFTAFAKDIADIIIPLANDICDDAPDDIAPKFKSSKQGESMGLYFPGGSSIKLVGVDLHPRALRGRGLDGAAGTEAGYTRNLKSTITRVVYPQFQRRPHARLILESNAPDEIDHDFDKYFIPDAKERDAYVFGTIEDNTALPEHEREEFIAALGGRSDPRCQREYFGIRVRDPERTVVPEFDDQKHVARVIVPPYACTFVAQDPGHSDLFGLVWGYWHFELGKLVIQRSWAKRNAGTAEVAAVIAATNAELWEGDAPLRWWDGPEEHTNPALHVSDVDPRLQHDLNAQYDMHVRAADKGRKNHGIGEAKLYKLRDGFGDDLIVIDPRDPGPLRDHLRNALWNERRKDLIRHEVYGHFDCLMALLYLWNALGRWRNVNPNKPAIYTGRESDRVFGPNYAPPMSQAQREAAALFGNRAGAPRHPSPGLVKPTQTPFIRCPFCSKGGRWDFWSETALTYVCSQECSDKWTYRSTGGKKPT